MYKLILVDDEADVREGILQEVNWEECGFEVAGTAENGREALELVEKVIPDVVITDIKMPFMDGLRLAELIKEKYPTMKTVILTGFDEFEFAQKAIKLNVMEYLLKPFSAGELVEILAKVKICIDEEISERENIQKLRKHYLESIHVLREKFLASLITEKLKRAEIDEKLKNYDLKLNGAGYAVSVISIDRNTVMPDSGLHKRDPAGYEPFNILEEKELLNFAVLNVSDEIVQRHNLGMAFLHNDSIIIISVCSESGSEQVLEKTVPVLEEIRQCIEKYLRFTVTIGVGTTCSEIESLGNSYQNALSALDYKVIIGNNRVVCIEDIEPQCVESLVFDELKERALSSCIKVGTAEEIEGVIEDIFEHVVDARTSIKDYQIYLLEIITTVLKAAKDSNIDMANIFGNSYNLLVELYKFDNIHAIKGWIRDICIRIMDYITRERQDTYKLLSEKAKNYVKEHYFESDMSMNKICSHLHISPAYLSLIFKKENKTTFVNYLTQMRMEAAKKLLRTTDFKSFEVAERVGYTDANYFSFCFKKNFNLSPSEYRNSFARNG